MFAAALAVSAVACRDDTPSRRAPPTTDTAAAIGAAADRPAPPAPAQLGRFDARQTMSSLGCRNDGFGPCQVLAAFESCKEWKEPPAFERKRWVGHGFRVRDRAFTEELTIMAARRLGEAEAAGGVQARLAIDTIPDLQPEAAQAAPDLIAALRAERAPDPTSPTVHYLQGRDDWPEAFVAREEGDRIFVADQAGSYLCWKEKGQVVLAQQAARRLHGADGLYAILWPVP